MGRDDFTDAIKRMLHIISVTPKLTPQNLGVKTEDGEIIDAVHNHVANAHQLVQATKEAVNGAEQYLALKAAQEELEELNSVLFSAHQANLLNENEYINLLQESQLLIDLLSDFSDPEYA